MIKVYCAGKIAKNDWRHDIFKELRNYERPSIQKEQPPKVDNFIYAGPYFISCDHGCYHGPHTHGLGVDVGISNCAGVDEERITRSEVISKCLRWMSNSDIIFVWFDDITAYGTLVEIGIAKAINKPIFFAMKRELSVRYCEDCSAHALFGNHKDFWFAWELADISIIVNNHLIAWNLFKGIADKMVKRDIDYNIPHLIYQVDKNCVVVNVKQK